MGWNDGWDVEGGLNSALPLLWVEDIDEAAETEQGTVVDASTPVMEATDWVDGTSVGSRLVHNAGVTMTWVGGGHGE